MVRTPTRKGAEKILNHLLTTEDPAIVEHMRLSRLSNKGCRKDVDALFERKLFEHIFNKGNFHRQLIVEAKWFQIYTIETGLHFVPIHCPDEERPTRAVLQQLINSSRSRAIKDGIRFFLDHTTLPREKMTVAEQEARDKAFLNLPDIPARNRFKRKGRRN